MTPRYPEIMLGEPICIKLKHIFFPEMEWSKSCYEQVGQKFTDLKKIVRKFFPDKTDIEILQILGKFTENDIKDMFE